MIMLMPDEFKREDEFDVFIETEWKKYTRELSKRLVKGKFICGDNLTYFDFMVAGFWTNIIENPNHKHVEIKKLLVD